MPRLTRVTQKVFASAASNNGQFGSGADNTKVLTNNITTLQANAAWPLGWNAATIGARLFPPLEEMQSLNYINTSQLSYIFQEGISEYDVGTTYYQNSIVKKPGTYQLYGSVTDSNVGNVLTDAANWVFLQDLSVTFQHATTSVFGTVQLAVETDIAAGSVSTNILTAAQASAHGFVTGDWKGTTLSTLQAGWIWGAGTIGNASSNATSRANADTAALFKAYWEDAAYNYTGTTATGAALQVYTSAGATVAKGANAAADFAANRQIAVVDFRDRTVAGRGNMVGSAGRLSGQPGGLSGNGLGNAGGLETNTLLQANLPSVTLASNTNSGPAGRGQTPFNKAAYQYSGVNDGGNDTVPLGGSDTPHNNVQPTIITNIIIKL